MSAAANTPSLIWQAGVYRIRVVGRLGLEWTDRLHEMTVKTHHEQDHGVITELCGTLPDQAALMGMLQQLYGHGAPLLSVEWLPAREARRAGGTGAAAGSAG